ncbi:MAG TPA: twin-arginine translocation signal domain-containing protein [Aestuariivirgaceae bacterium]|nr:twin-arginine translocation signal domain-containing protein [Aestuariivirgaceae bacterium]
MDSNATALSRRSFLKASGATTMVLAAGAIINPIEAWGLEVKTLKPETMRTLIQMARDIYPHDRLADRYYAVALKGYDGAAADDAELHKLLESGAAALDGAAQKMHGASYVETPWEADRVAILRTMEAEPYFQKVRGDLVTGIYNNPETWPLFGYEGESFSKGGYIDRGFDDIEWL